MIPAPPPAEIQLVSSWTDKLIYMSESEAPLTVLPTGLAKGDLGKALEQAMGQPVGLLTEVPVDAFFEKILRQQRKARR